MAVNERGRRELHARLAEAIGEEAADELMEQLPPVPWHALATHADVDRSVVLVRADLEREMGALRAELRGDMRALRAELKGDMAALRAELKGDLATLGAHLETRMANQTRTLVFSMLGMWLASMSVIGGLVASTSH